MLPHAKTFHSHDDSDKSFGWLIISCLLLLFSMSLPDSSHADPYSLASNSQGTGQLFLVDDNGGQTESLLINTDVMAEINGLMATTTFTQHFSNQTDTWKEGVYVFPLPDSAAVNYMEMHIGERKIVGQIKEKMAAKKAYEEAKRAGKRAALTEQQRPNVFTQKVANIPPHETISVQIRLVETVAFDMGTFHWRLPLTITPRYVPLNDESSSNLVISDSGWNTDEKNQLIETKPTLNGVEEITPPMTTETKSNSHRATIHITVNSGLPLANIDATYHSISVNKHANKHEISLSEGTTVMDRDFELVWRPRQSQVPQAALFTETVDAENFGVLMMIPPQPEKDPYAGLARDMVFVIDTSGSMSGTSIEQAKRSLNLALDKLAPNDRFNILEFNSGTFPLFQQPVNADEHAITQAKAWLNALNARGGTEMYDALDQAMGQFSDTESTNLQQIVFITDGAVANEAELFKLIHNKLGNSRLFTVGIGSAPNSFFMRKSAKFGRGTFTHIGNIGEVSEKMEALFTKLESAVVSSITIQWPGATEQFPAMVPDLYLSEPMLISAKIPTGTNSIDISGLTAGQTWTKHIEATCCSSDIGAGAIWARSKIDTLEDTKALQGESDAIKQEITDVALKHQLLSAYTSFIAIEEVPARSENTALEKEKIPNKVAHGQQFQATQMTRQSIAYPRTATNAGMTLWLGLFSLMALIVVIRLRDDK